MKKITFSDKYGLTDAVLSGKKTQVRRIISNPATYKGKEVIGFHIYRRKSDGAILGNPIMVDEDGYDIDGAYILPRYKVGEIVAVAQSYKDIGIIPTANVIGSDSEHHAFLATKSKGFDNKMFVKADLMPHQIRITNVRIERLQDISDEDCLKEGVVKDKCGSADTHYMEAYYFPKPYQPYCTPRQVYAELIDKVSGKGTWESNPFVFVYEFELVK